MAFPTIAATNTSVESADTTTHNCALPTLSANQLLLVLLSMDGSTGSIDVPAGWSQGWTDELHSSGVKFALRYKIASGSEGATLDLTSTVSEKSAHQSFAITVGTFDTTTPVETARAEGTDAAPNPPSLTITGGPLDVLWLAAYGADDDDNGSAAPTSYTDLVYNESDASTTSCSMATARRNLNASTEDPGTFTIAASEEWLAAIVAVRPSAGAAPGPAFPLHRSARALLRR